MKEVAVAEMQVKVNLIPTDETMEIIRGLLNMWQDANPMKEMRLVPEGDHYSYRIVDRDYSARTEGDGA